MANAKTATLTLRIDPAIKEALRAVPEKEHRSIANIIEVLVRDYANRTASVFQNSKRYF